ncbi:MBG domain-containing protein (plasmid) [Azospirillum sp. A26]|uniref:beta strand repeat-containing protein n=1 Tax=Azospirillum sp. A26 TaxID=3160607 RepID=UPI0036710ECE
MESAIAPASAQTLPAGPSVTAGAVSIATPSGTSVIIDQTSRNAVINWNSFSIGSGNSVAINNGGGATLNRVTGNIPSRIDGSLTATGSVYLVNPAGVAVGPGGKVLTGGSFTASTLDIPDAAFLNGGDKSFSGTSKATVTNAGSIGSLGGDVALIAREVTNTGTLTAPKGTVGLAAGYEVLVKDSAVEGGKFQVKVGGSDTAATTSGRIAAAAAEIRANGGNVYALAGNTGGVIAATGTASSGGRIFLTAGDGGTVEAGGTLAATRTTETGAVEGGDIRVSGGKATVTGTLSARGSAGKSKEEKGKGGKNAAGKGGTVAVTGTAVTVTGTATVDVSGSRGGAIAVGGDYQGGKDAARKTLKETVATARTASVAAGARLSADGADSDGGSVVVWSDEHTDFAGTITARGAGAGGKGGDAEVSGKATLSFHGTADLTAVSGAFGTLLLDPYNVTISAGSDSNVSDLSGVFTAGGNDSVLSVATLNDALTRANVEVSTGSGGSQAGTITVAAPVTWSTNAALTLAAAGDIVINASITATGDSARLNLDYGVGRGYSIASNASVTMSGSAPTLRIGETGTFQYYQTISSLADLASIDSSGATGRYALVKNLDAAGTTYTSALVSRMFNGTFAGLGNTISNLTVNAPGTDNVGLFATIGGSGVVRDLTLTGATLSGKGFVGGLAGSNGGTITRTHVTGTVTGAGDDVGVLAGLNMGTITLSDAGGTVTGRTGVGGLVGRNTGTITQSHAAVTVTGDTNVGGLVGESENGTVNTVYATGAVHGSSSVGGLIGDSSADSVTKAYATGAVSGDETVGGLIGALRNGAGSLSESYATGAVTATVNKAGGLLGGVEDATVTNVYATGSATGTIDASDGEHYVGGLVGDNFYGTITNAYATGLVTLAATCTASDCKAGGLAGRNAEGSINTSYWDKGTTGRATAAGDPGNGTVNTVIGIETADAFSTATYGNFDLANSWYLVDGQTRPFLRSEHATSIANAHQLQLMRLDLSAAYTLAANVDAGETGGSNAAGMWSIGGNKHGFVPVGGSSTPFTGSLDGQGHVIQRLAIRPEDYSGTNQGLFGVIGAAGNVRDIGLTDLAITGAGYTVGGLAGQNDGTITNAYVTGSVKGSAAGGLVGKNTGTISRSYVKATVSQPTIGGDEIGGLVSENTGTITQSYATGDVTGRGTVGGFAAKNSGTITQSYATGAVTGGIGTDIGGFVGNNTGSISQSYATGGAVSGNSSVGGFVGMNNGNISQSYAAKAVSGSSTVGGFFGFYASGTITSSYFDTTVAGTAEHAGSASRVTGMTGLTTAQFQDTASFMTGASGWDFDTVWVPPSSGYYPVLYSMAPVTWVKAVSANTVYGSGSGTVTAIGTQSSLSSYIFGKAGDSLPLTGAMIATDPTAAVSAMPTTASLPASNATVTSAKGTDYRVFYYGSAALTVDPAALTVTADAARKTYGDSASLTGFTATGLKNSDSVTGVSLSSTGTAATAGVGSYSIAAASAQGSGLSNYTVTYVDGALTVLPRSILVTADSLSRPIGTGNPALIYTIGGQGLVNGDTLGGVLSTAAGTASPAGSYTIEQGMLAASSNYSLTFMPGVLTVTATAETVTPQPPSGPVQMEELTQVLAVAALPRNRVVLTASPTTQPLRNEDAPVSFLTAGPQAASGDASATAASASGGSSGGSGSQETAGGAAACIGGAAASSDCTAAPHPENTRFGRFLHFSMP